MLPPNDEPVIEKQYRAVEHSDGALLSSSDEALYRFSGRPLVDPVRPATVRVAIKSNKKIVFVDPIDLISARAHGRYVVMHHKSGSYLLRGSLSRVERGLAPYGFVRIHKSLLVNSAWVHEIRPHFNGEYRLLLKDGRQLKTTRTYKKRLLQLAALWF